LLWICHQFSQELLFVLHDLKLFLGILDFVLSLILWLSRLSRWKLSFLLLCKEEISQRERERERDKERERERGFQQSTLPSSRDRFLFLGSSDDVFGHQ
jgi:hypothetical protein